MKLESPRYNSIKIFHDFNPAYVSILLGNPRWIMWIKGTFMLNLYTHYSLSHSESSASQINIDILYKNNVKWNKLTLNYWQKIAL